MIGHGKQFFWHIRSSKIVHFTAYYWIDEHRFGRFNTKEDISHV